MRMWACPSVPTGGGDPELSIGSTRYAVDSRTGECEVRAEHVQQALKAGWIPADHPECRNWQAAHPNGFWG